jgi:hypothetical protein
MKVDVRLTEEEKNLVPDFEKRLKRFQSSMDMMSRSEVFDLCLHEGSHAVQHRKLGWNVEFQGPHMYYKDGKLHHMAGAVVPIPDNYDPLHWQHAMVSVAGFYFVNHFTAVPNEPYVIQNDLETLRFKLGPNGDMNQAVYYAEVMLEDQLSDPTFLPELERAVRDYELAIYGTDEATQWGWREYHPELPGTRHRVIVPYSGNFGTLVEQEGNLRLVVEGDVFHPSDELRGGSLEVRIGEPEKVGTSRVVEKWNQAVTTKLASC